MKLPSNGLKLAQLLGQPCDSYARSEAAHRRPLQRAERVRVRALAGPDLLTLGRGGLQRALELPKREHGLPARPISARTPRPWQTL